MTPPAPGRGPTPMGESEPPRITSLPFFYTAPVALSIAGALLLGWGALALSTPWSSLTLAFTHVITLGFLTMTGLGSFYVLAARSGAVTIARPRLTHLVYYGLVIGAVGLVWGTARAQSAPVFAAIGAVGLAVVVFIFQASLALKRRAGGRAEVRALRLALWGFSLAVFLGLWLAHGHGGMRFPGLRSLWMQVHLCIALLGWLGGMLVALSGVALPESFAAPALTKRNLDGLLAMTAVGIFVPFGLLLYGYFFVPTADQGWIEPWAIGSLVPALGAIWGVHPALCLNSLRSGTPAPGYRHWQVGLALAPIVLALGVAAWFLGDVRLGLLFGWLALVGWAGTLFSGLLLGTIPSLIALRGAERPGGEEGTPGAPLSGLVGASRVALLLHGAALGTGAVGILFQSDLGCRLAGALVLADGAWLLVALTRALSGSRPRRGEAT